MIAVVQPSSGTYRAVVDHLLARGAKSIVIDRAGGRRRSSLPGKLSILIAMLNPRLFRLRAAWSNGDSLLVVGWIALSLMALVRWGVLPRPRRLVILGCFVHSPVVRGVVNRYLRLMRFDGLCFVAFSRGEAKNLVDQVGLPPECVLVHLWRQDLGGQVDADRVVDGGYVFSGGYSNRDYGLLLRALDGEPHRVVIVASGKNDVPVSGTDQVIVHRDLPEADFETHLAACRLVVLPLRSSGEACGQSVLLRVLRNGKALIATRHESIEEYLGADYPGFVPTEDKAALRAAVRRAMEDEEFRAQLVERVAAAASKLAALESPGAEIERFLLRDSAT